MSVNPAFLPQTAQPLEPWRQVLLEAAHMIRTHGHNRFDWVGPRGEVCVVKAITACARSDDFSGCDAGNNLRTFLQTPCLSAWSDATPTAEVLTALESCALGDAARGRPE